MYVTFHHWFRQSAEREKERKSGERKQDRKVFKIRPFRPERKNKRVLRHAHMLDMYVCTLCEQYVCVCVTCICCLTR